MSNNVAFIDEDDMPSSSDSQHSSDESCEASSISENSPEVNNMFQTIIKTEDGRRHLKRFPMVKALCCALQLSGYAAEMDDDGDIWFDDEDGDPYYDCLETQPDLAATGGYDAIPPCKFCQEPEKYGLGHIVLKAKDGLRRADEARKKLGVKGAGRHRDSPWR